MRLEVHSEAREEFLQAVAFYEAQVPGLGLRFIVEIERCQKALLETPLIGHPCGKRLRKFTVGDKFPYSILYAVLGEILFILAYAHGSRRPGYWRTRSVR
jgi:plasmid stabilization system protein ParE